MNTEARKLFNEELKAYKLARASNDYDKCHHHLGRAHIISQEDVRYHFYIHLVMFAYAVHLWEMKEVLGQVIRIFVTIPGHLIGKVPYGNIGWSTVSLTKSAPIPEDLKHLFKKKI